MRLRGDDIYLATLERDMCRKLWEDFEYDFENPCGIPYIGHSIEKADDWYESIQKEQGNKEIRLGIFMNNRSVIGDVGLQEIDRVNRSCDIGIGIAKIENRSKGYGHQAVGIMLNYAFKYLGIERITANTLDFNIGARKSLEKCGFTLEGVERKAVYVCGEMRDRYRFAMLKEEYKQK